MRNSEIPHSSPEKNDAYYLKRRVGALLGVINDQFTSMIEFCLTLPLGGHDLMEQLLRKLAILHTKNSFDSALFKNSYTPPANKMTAKDALEIPVIASINCISEGAWIDYAKDVEKVGADALELNLFILPAASSGRIAPPDHGA